MPVASTDIEPRDLGMPPRFHQWRMGQLQAFYATINAAQRFIAQCAQTGFGKSMYAVACALAFGVRVCIITSTKILADQYQFDFSSCGMRDIRGRHNYPCSMGGHVTCADGRILGCRDLSCPRAAAIAACKMSNLVITNYACYMHSYATGEGLGEFGMLILDEAHSIIDELCSFLEIRITHADYEHLYPMFGNPPHGRPLLQWRKWAADVAPDAKEHLDELRKNFAPAAQIKAADRFSADVTRLRKVADDWVLDEDPGVIAVFSPLWPTEHAEQLLFREVPKVIFLSATIVPKTTQILNVDPNDCLFLESPAVFDPARCPVYLFGSARIDFRTQEGQRAEWVARMDYLINQRYDRKGLIHTVSYNLQREIVGRSHNANIILAPTSFTLGSAVGAFRESPPPKLIASPALTTGYDFPMTAAEYQFVMKVPFIDARTKIMKARSTADPDYLPSITAQILAQTCGRNMRQPDDQDECFIMDSHFNWFIKKYRSLFPSEFYRRLRYTNGPPQPPPALIERGVTNNNHES